MVSVLLWSGVGIGPAGGGLQSHVSVSLSQRDAFSGDSVSLVRQGETCGGNARARGRSFPDFGHGGGSRLEAGKLAAAGRREKFLQPGGLGSTGHSVTGHMTVEARSIRKLMWFSCFTSSGGSAFVGWSGGERNKEKRQHELYKRCCANCFCVVYF